MIVPKFLRFHVLKLALVTWGDGNPENGNGGSWISRISRSGPVDKCRAGSARVHSLPRRGAEMRNPEEKNLMGLILTRVG